MSFALVASTAKGSAAGGPITSDPIDTTGANLLIVPFVEYVGAGATASIEDSEDNDWTYLTAYPSAAQERVRIAYSIPTSVGSGHEFTNNNGTSYSSIFPMAFSGGLAVDVLDPGKDTGTVDGGASPAKTASALTPSEDDCLVIGFTGFRASHSGTSVNGGFDFSGQVNYSGSVHFGGAAYYLIQGAAAVANPEYAFTGSDGWSTCLAVFRAAAGGGSILPIILNQSRRRRIR